MDSLKPFRLIFFMSEIRRKVMPERESQHSESLAEVREWLVRIDANQTHQTQLLETLNARVEKALDKADVAEDKAYEALRIAKRADQRIDDKEQEQKVRNRFLVGTAISVLGILLPVLLKFYGIT